MTEGSDWVLGVDTQKNDQISTILLCALNCKKGISMSTFIDRYYYLN